MLVSSLALCNFLEKSYLSWNTWNFMLSLEVFQQWSCIGSKFVLVSWISKEGSRACLSLYPSSLSTCIHVWTTYRKLPIFSRFHYASPVTFPSLKSISDPSSSVPFSVFMFLGNSWRESAPIHRTELMAIFLSKIQLYLYVSPLSLL